MGFFVLLAAIVSLIFKIYLGMLGYSFPLVCGNTFLVSFLHIQTLQLLYPFLLVSSSIIIPLIDIAVLLFYSNEFGFPEPALCTRILWKGARAGERSLLLSVRTLPLLHEGMLSVRYAFPV